MIKNLVEKVEEEISELNERSYNIRFDIRQIDAALEHKDKFDLKEIVEVYGEADISFPAQLKRQYEELVEFNRKVTNERNAALRGRRRALVTEISEIETRKAAFGR